MNDDFRVANPIEIAALLQRLADQGTLVHVAAGERAPYATVVVAVDAKARRISLDALPSHPAVTALVEAGEATAVAHLDAVKLQFDLASLVLVHGPSESALLAPLPEVLYRFQRRASFRVRARGGATAQCAHPAQPKLALALRVLDVSTGGCALALPPETPGIDAGSVIQRVHIELDADTRIDTALTVQHVSGGFSTPRTGQRLGCAFGTLDGPSQRALQRYIDLTQRRMRALAVG